MYVVYDLLPRPLEQQLSIPCDGGDVAPPDDDAHEAEVDKLPHLGLGELGGVEEDVDSIELAL